MPLRHALPEICPCPYPMAEPASPGAPLYTVAVRALCEFTAKEGDLDLRFTPSPTAQEGVAGHTLVRSRRSADYQSEIALSGDFGAMRVRGRADGYDPLLGRLEEIKTFRGDVTRIRENHRILHWAQLKIYGHLFCQQENRASIDLALVYLEIGSGKETVLCETWQQTDLRDFFETQCQRFIAWAEQEIAHRATRDTALQNMSFPFADFRPGQRHLAESVYKSAVQQRRLLIQAPTGIGKTVGTLFPMLKACPVQRIDKVFYLTAKTSGRALALAALRRLVADNSDAPKSATASTTGSTDIAGTTGTTGTKAIGQPLRVVELVAREKACEYPDRACHGDACPLARGFYDRLPVARAAALHEPVLDRDTLRSVALAHNVCPYYLSQEMVRWSDVIAGDYNYFFDLSAMLFGLAQANQWRVSLLVDEAHNLLERARAMYSAALNPHDLLVAKRHASGDIKRALSKIQRDWKALAASVTPAANEEEDGVRDAAAVTSTAAIVHTAEVFSALRQKFMPSLQQGMVAIGEHFVEHPADTHPDLLRFYFDAMHFVKVAERFDKHAFSASLDSPRAARALPSLALRNIVPAALLKPRFDAVLSAGLFSATLSPARFYADTLGLPDNYIWVEVASPFCADQLEVQVISSVSTRWQDRERSLDALTDLMARQYDKQPGNYLAFFSSYDYLRQAVTRLRERHPSLPCTEQAPRMSEADQAAFLDSFTEHSRGIGFVVLGGAFGEGVDLPGKRLIGAFIATLGLPQWSPFNEAIKECMGANFGESLAYDYAYLYPGIRKVVQAAGRVIRAPEDRGTVFLVDDRFARKNVQRLLPSWWRIALSSSSSSS